MTLSVVIPAYQEASTIEATVSSVHHMWRIRGEIAEIVVIDDGSTDGTGDVVDGLRLPGVRVLRQEKRGKGAALQAGVVTSTGEQLYFIDADLPYAPKDQLRVVDTLRAGAPVAVGSRRAPGSSASTYPFTRRLSSACLGRLVKVTLGVASSDTQCGLKGFDGALARRLFPLLRIPGFGFDLEIFALLAAWRIPVVECPVHLTHRRASTVQQTRDAPRILKDLKETRRRLREGRYTLGEHPTPPVRLPAAGGHPELAGRAHQRQGTT